MKKRPMKRRRGLTLIELLLVLALLGVMGSMAAPLFGNGFAKVTLRRAGDELLAAWAKARTQAIESGEIQQFRFQAETPKYRVESQMQAEAVEAGEAVEREDNARSDADYEPDGEEDDGDGDGGDDEQGLEEGIVFHTGRALDEKPTNLSTEENAVMQLNAGEQEWSEPVLFFPDGTTSTAVVTLKNAQDQYLQVTLRGLTGIGRASDVLTQSEWQDVEK